MAIYDTVKGFVPEIPELSGSFIFGLLTYIILFIVFLVIAVVLVYFVIMRLRYNKKIIIFEKINGQFEPTRRDKAMLIRHGKIGDTILFIRKLKKYLPTPTLQVGRNTYYFFMRKDGELINFSFADFDKQSQELGVKFLDIEMRYARTSLENTLKERYNRPKFWQQYGALMINIAVIVVIMVFLWLIVDKMIELVSNINQVMELATGVLDETQKQVTALNNIKSGTGYVTVE